MDDFLKSAAFTWVLNGIFFVAIALAFIVASKSLRSGHRQNYVEYAPSLMTSLGLFGTFLGILIGLFQFDSKHIDGSIQQLLSGLQTAFVTSIMGMAAAILFKIKQTGHMDRASEMKSDVPLRDITPKDIHAEMVKQHQALSFIAKGIGGDGDRSLIGQLQMLRTEVTDFSTKLQGRQEKFEDQLWSQMNAFAEMMSKSATEQVIEALKQVIVEFNQKLTEQFGENFQKLDASVQKLVEWQHNYMQQLDDMTKLYRLGTESIEATKNAVESIRSETARIPQDMEQLNSVITVNQHQITELTRHLDAFVSMRNEAVIAVPQIQQKLEQVGEQLLSGADKVNMMLIQGSAQFEESVKHTNSSLINSANAISSQSEKISDDMKDALELLGLNTERIRTGITATISESMTAVSEKSQDIVSKSGDAVDAVLAGLRKAMEQAVDGSDRARVETQRAMDANNTAMVQYADRSLQAVEKQVQEAVNRTNEAVNAQLRQLDEALSRQLNAALQELGSSLATIAGHLVQTYRRESDRAGASVI